MSHEDVLLVVDAIRSVAWSVHGVVWALSIGIAIREIRRGRD